uniref:Uncharacterized protein n=1 Tax=Rhizophora mucronata TaxID=61149 RepID=A0A2P2NWD8_RHIMU
MREPVMLAITWLAECFQQNLLSSLENRLIAIPVTQDYAYSFCYKLIHTSI